MSSSELAAHDTEGAEDDGHPRRRHSVNPREVLDAIRIVATVTPCPGTALDLGCQGENLERNLELVPRLRQTADERGATVAQAAIAWVLSRSDDIVVLVGARRRDRLQESLGALEVELGEAELARIEEAVSRPARRPGGATPTSSWANSTASADRGEGRQ